MFGAPFRKLQIHNRDERAAAGPKMASDILADSPVFLLIGIAADDVIEAKHEIVRPS